MAKILFIASNYGLWGEELQAPWDACKNAGFENFLATYKGITPLPMLNSTVAGYVDPVTNQVITPKEVAERVNEILDNGEWDNVIKIQDVNMDNYDVLVLVGGHGSFLDVIGNAHVHKLIVETYKSGKIVAALCAPCASLALTRDPDKKNVSIMRGRRTAAHPREWDYVVDLPYIFARATEANPSLNFVTPGFLYPTQNVIEDATGDPNLVSADPNADREHPVVVWDEPFLTAQSIESSIAFGEKLVSLINEKNI
jgi:putative intracellular protease/amidase